jgi:Icc protein
VERTLAHISDLHLGRDRQTDANVARLAGALCEAGVDAVLVTGDVTHRGRRAELALFDALFAPLRDHIMVVPGNHDRLGEDAARVLMPHARVTVEARPGLHVVRLDSTAPHNRALLSAHGELSEGDIAAVDSAVGAVPPGTLVALMLHHHLLPLPEDHLSERLASWLGWPNAAELARGRDLLQAVSGRCDLVAHGHRHAASSIVLPSAPGRPLHVMNAGSTADLGFCRVLVHADGRLLAERRLDLTRLRVTPAARLLPVAA